MFCSISVSFVYVPRDTTRGLITPMRDGNSDRARKGKTALLMSVFTLHACRLFILCLTKIDVVIVVVVV